MKNEFYQTLRDKIDLAENILISTHVNPDADGLGSQVALSALLKKLGKNPYIVNEARLEKRYQFLQKMSNIYSFEQFQKDFPLFNPDLCIIVDTHKVSRIGKKVGQYLSLVPDIIYIDHHPFPKPIANKHFIDTSASATGEIIANLIKSFEVKFTKDMSIALYMSILIDTNTFRYPSVTSHTHRLIADFLDSGIKTTEIYNLLYGTKKLQHMHLLGHILSNTQVSASGKIAWLEIKDEVLKKFKVKFEETHAYINNLLVLEGVKVVCMFRENQKKLRLSLRSHGDIDVGEIAIELGGGGHTHSSATVMQIPANMDSQQVISICLKKIEEFI